ncbi:hypothetical protein [Streptococcus loxodontisalivarius]|uniref:hypothetical protein n=1 Tax=Streptococcus loxodontisalivarius TaxID=1349415 RepID=UPI0036084D7D
MEGSTGKMKKLTYYFMVFWVLSPIFILSIFVELRLFALAGCLFWWFIFMGLYVRPEESANQFEIIEKTDKKR